MVDVVEELRKIKEKKDQGVWLPANNGTEIPFFTRSGRRLLYCWQPSTGKHAYLDCDSDIFLSDQEAFNYLSI